MRPARRMRWRPAGSPCTGNGPRRCADFSRVGSGGRTSDLSSRGTVPGIRVIVLGVEQLRVVGGLRLKVGDGGVSLRELLREISLEIVNPGLLIGDLRVIVGDLSLQQVEFALDVTA